MLIKGIYKELLYNIINDILTEEKLNSFIKSYIIIVKNETDREFPRFSKTPFTKWYVKGYSKNSEIVKILNAMDNDTVEQLNKNLKIIATKTKIIKTTKITESD